MIIIRNGKVQESSFRKSYFIDEKSLHEKHNCFQVINRKLVASLNNEKPDGISEYI